MFHGIRYADRIARRVSRRTATTAKPSRPDGGDARPVQTDDEPRILPVLVALAAILYAAAWLLAGPPIDNDTAQAISGRGGPADSFLTH